MPQYKLPLYPGDRVRNIRMHSSRKGWTGTVHAVGDNRNQIRVKYDNGTSQCYLKTMAHISLTRISGECPCQQHVLKLDYSKLEEHALAAMLEEAKRGTPTYILSAFHDEIMFTHTRRTIKKVRRNVITGKTQDDMVRDLGHARGVQQFNTRSIGTSTGQALRVIGDAMCNPTTEIRLTDIDHAISDGNKAPRHRTNDDFRRLVQAHIGDMKGFSFTPTHIVFNPIVTEETYVETH